MADYTIWHNPKCSTSRFVLGALQDAGVGLCVRDYQKQPPTADDLRDALDRLGITPRDLLRRRNTPHHDLGLGDPVLTDDALIAAMAEHPALIERPVVFGPNGARLCRPRETVFDLLAG